MIINVNAEDYENITLGQLPDDCLAKIVDCPPDMYSFSVGDIVIRMCLEASDGTFAGRYVANLNTNCLCRLELCSNVKCRPLTNSITLRNE